MKDGQQSEEIVELACALRDIATSEAYGAAVQVPALEMVQIFFNKCTAEDNILSEDFDEVDGSKRNFLFHDPHVPIPRVPVPTLPRVTPGLTLHCFGWALSALLAIFPCSPRQQAQRQRSHHQLRALDLELLVQDCVVGRDERADRPPCRDDERHNRTADRRQGLPWLVQCGAFQTVPIVPLPPKLPAV